jgi:NAD+ diphosphatase
MSQFPLDRQAVQRRNSTYISDLFSAQQACLIPLSASQVLVMNSQDHSSNGSSRNSSSGSAAAPALAPVLLSPAAPVASQLAVSPADAIFLGVDGQGRPFFAAEVKDKDAVLTCAQAAAAAAASGDGGAGMMWRDARLAGQDLSPEDASLLAVASSLAQWHAGNGYSSMDGAPTRPSAAGHARRSQGSKRSVYPRIDPATIMLVTVPRPASLNTTTTSVSTNSSSLTAGHPVAGDWCLLGRKAEWPPGRYSTLAGFLEVGRAQ